MHTSSSQQAHLLRLPAELRNIIWGYALGSNTFDIHCWFSYSRERIITKVLNRQKNFLSLLRTCRQIYSEAHLLPYRFNGFRIRNEDAIIPWLNGLERSRLNTITEIHLVTWRARRMLEGTTFFPKPMTDVIPLQRLPSLRRLCVEVRVQRSGQLCKQRACGTCHACDAELLQSEEQLRSYVTNQNKKVEVIFERVIFATVAALWAL
jgi:hypothetical protein